MNEKTARLINRSAARANMSRKVAKRMWRNLSSEGRAVARKELAATLRAPANAKLDKARVLIALGGVE